MQLVCNPKGTTVFNMPTFSHKRVSRPPLLKRLCALAGDNAVIGFSDLRRRGIHHQILKRAVERGLIKKVGRGLYTAASRPLDLEHRIALACRRVPHGVVCLETALRFHGILPAESDVVWMAIDRKARKPIVKGLEMRFVRFSGQALKQGVLNTRIDGEAVRIYSVAKTVADCLKYRRRIGIETAMHAFQTSRRLNKCSRERLIHFANIRRVASLIRLSSESTSRHSAHALLLLQSRWACMRFRTPCHSAIFSSAVINTVLSCTAFLP